MTEFSPGLALAALAVRLLGEGLARTDLPGVSSLGIAVRHVATWLAVGSVGTAAPLWLGLAAGAAGVLVSRAAGREEWHLVVDAAVVLAGVAVAVPAVPASLALVQAVVLVAAWAALHAVLAADGRAIPVLAVIGGVAAAYGLQKVGGAALDRPLYDVRDAAPHFALVPTCEGDSVSLPGGQVAWRAGSPDRDEGLALLFHGADPGGSRQPTACGIRRALRDRGFDVLALDHPGYGSSAAPDSAAPIEEWDPLRAVDAALRSVAEEDRARRPLVVGHSMGAVDATRLMARAPELRGVVLVGAALSPSDTFSEYWFGRFHEDRGLRYRLSREKYQRIADRYYDAGSALSALAPGHPSVSFVEVEHEHGDLLEGRREFFDRLPGGKARVRLGGATHYLNTFRIPVVDAVALDTRVLDRLGEAIDEAAR